MRHFALKKKKKNKKQQKKCVLKISLKHINNPVKNKGEKAKNVHVPSITSTKTSEGASSGEMSSGPWQYPKFISPGSGPTVPFPVDPSPTTPEPTPIQ